MTKQYAVFTEVKQVTKFYLVEVESDENLHGRWGDEVPNEIHNEVRQKFMDKKRRYVGKKEEQPFMSYADSSNIYSLDTFCGLCAGRLSRQYGSSYWCERCQKDQFYDFHDFQIFSYGGNERMALEDIEEMGEIKGLVSRYDRKQKKRS